MRRVVGAALVLCGCTVGEDFHAPRVASPAAWRGQARDVASVTAGGAVDAQWWRGFGDAELDSLVGRLGARNLDLKQAAERVLQGRAQTRVAASEGLPGVTYNTHYQRERLSAKGPEGPEIYEVRPGAPVEIDDWLQGFSASWDLDLFGRVRRSVEAQRANTEADEEMRNEVALAAAADMATDYIQLRGVQARLGITARNLEAADRNVGLVVTRFDNGVATTLEVAQAKSQRAMVAETVPALRQQAAELENAIGVLLDEPPGALEGELAGPGRQPAGPAVVHVGAPAEMIRRRPDVREAEARLHAATAETGVAVASFYPDIRLTGDFNLEGLRFANLWDLEARAFQVGPTLSLPIFEGGRRRGVLMLRKSQQREAGLAFEKTVLRAWAEVDDDMVAYAEAQRARVEIGEAVREDRVALDAARQQYRAGAVDFLNVVSAEAALLRSESAGAESDAEIGTDLVRVYRGLGG